MIEVNKDVCIGCGACAATCPDNFAMDDDGKSKVLNQEKSDCVEAAAAGCPVSAITVS